MTDLIKNLLEKRGVNTENREEVEKFLKPNWDRDTHNPFHMKDIEKAVDRIKKAIDNNEKIIIYSDYDCDGIPGAVVLHDFFKKIEESKRQKDKLENKKEENKNGEDLSLINKEFNKKATKTNKKEGEELKEFSVNFENYIPHRHNEGYGIHKHAIEKFIKDKATLMITVDLGITNIEEIEYAQENGIDVILTDHHLPILNENKKQVLPSAFAVINTKRNDCDYPEKMLCGCATAWKLAHAFLMKHRIEYGVADGYEKWWLDMVGISTVADMVPLLGENRTLAVYGLQVLRKSKRQGLLKIFTNARIKQQYINETDIGFGIAPRLNAAGRMSDPREAFLALLDNTDSDMCAMRLEKYNNERKKDTGAANESVDFALFENDQVVLVGSEDWSPGILGLIASKIVDRTKKTVFVWGKGEDENIMKGSVRAGSDGANVVQLMSACADTLIHFGGHEQAGGFAIIKDKIKDFEKKLKEEYEKHQKSLAEKKEEKARLENISLEINKEKSFDLALNSQSITESLFREINKLSPFGMANLAPIIKLEGDLKNVRLFGDKKQHIELSVDGVSCIKFSVSEAEKEKLIGQKFWLGFIERDIFKGGLKIRLV